MNRREMMQASLAVATCAPAIQHAPTLTGTASTAKLTVVGYERGMWLLSNGRRVSQWSAIGSKTFNANVVRDWCRSDERGNTDWMYENPCCLYDYAVLTGSCIEEEKDAAAKRLV